MSKRTEGVLTLLAILGQFTVAWIIAIGAMRYAAPQASVALLALISACIFAYAFGSAVALRGRISDAMRDILADAVFPE